MKIEVPYEYGQQVFYMKDNRIKTAIVEAYKVSEKFVLLVYAVPQNENTCLGVEFHYDRVFATKQELLDSL